MHNTVRNMLLSANIPLSADVEAAIDESFPSEEAKRTTVSAVKGRLSSEVTHSALRYKALFESNGEDMQTMVSHLLDDYLLFGIPLREEEILLLTRGGNISLSEALSSPPTS